MGLRLKFNAVLVAASLVGIGAAVGISFVFVQDYAKRDVERDVALMRANASAVRNYTLTHIEPLLADDREVLFQPEAVTSFAARTVFSAVSEQFPQYTYKEAALNPTNPDDLPNAVERDMIEQFRADPNLASLLAEVDSDTGPVLAVAFPITINKKGCLNCHSTPEVAPAAMVDLYGSVNGFGWQLGETIGAQIVTAPLSLVAERARETALLVGASLAGAFVLVLLVSNFLLSRVVLRPVRYLSVMAEEVSLGDFSVREYNTKGKDEINALGVSFNRMRRSLERAMAMLDE